MQHLNYHHLLYFWTVAREGSLTEGASKLHLTPQTISSQLRALEDALGEQLFDRSGRQLGLTEIGRVVFRYADDIFSLGRELIDSLEGRLSGRPLKLVVGVADVLPKLVAHQLIQPVFGLDEQVQVECRADTTERLLAALAVHELDVVLSDAPIPATANVRAFNHVLGECGVTFMASSPLVTAYRKGFPGSLDNAPFLLPTDGTTLRRSLDRWFDQKRIQPRIVGEFDDSALLKVFGQAGAGIFCVPAIVEDEVRRRYKVKKLGATNDLVERFYAISIERRIQHPAVAVVCDTARKRTFE